MFRNQGYTTSMRSPLNLYPSATGFTHAKLRCTRPFGCNIEDLRHSSRPEVIGVSDGVGDEHEHIHRHHSDVQILVVSSAPKLSINCTV